MEKRICLYCYRYNQKIIINRSVDFDKLELVVFDMDGVLADIISSWKYIHDYFNTSNEESVDDYLKGNIDDMEFIRRDVALWKENDVPITKDTLEQILSDVPLMKGAKDCVKELKENNVKTAIVSAGLDLLADRVQRELGIDHALSNGIKTDENGRLNGVGVVGVRLKHKDDAVRSLSESLNIPFNRIVSVGNSCFDIPMFEITGLSIAFNPEDDCVRDAADFVVFDKDLGNILPFLKNHIN
jgi:phosphoserine phosphatase